MLEALQLAEKEEKQKAREKRICHLNAEFQRIVRDKKAFLSDQCKEIEENNGMGKTRDLFKKIRDTIGTFHAKMGTIKDLQYVRPGFEPWVGKIPWRRKGQSTPVLLPGKSHGQRRSLVGYSLWGCKESDMTERLHFHFLP